MVNIDIYKKSGKCQEILALLALLFLISLSEQVVALDWTFRPNLFIREVFSDNINQDSTNRKSALVTEVSPGFSIHSTSTINTFDLNYRMQTLYNAGGDSGLDINNQLQLNSKYQFLKNSLYMDTRSSISQQNVSNRNISSDNISGGDTSTVETLSLSPYWTPHFKSFADGEVRVTYDRVSTSSGGQSTFSDTDTFSQNIRLNSGRYFSRFSWFLAFNNREQFNSDGDDVKFQDSTAELRTFLNRELSGFIRVGHAENQFQTTTNSNRNGVFYTVGAQWRPSARFSVEAGYGNNAFVTVNISPIRRINWSTTYSNNDIGTNTGDRWQSSLRYNTRRSVWSINYSEDTQTTQQLLLERQQFSNREILESLFPGTNIDSVSDTEIDATVAFLSQNGLNTNQFFRDLESLTDEVFVNKRANILVSFRTGKSIFSVNGYKTRREFEFSQNQEDVYGISGSWSWNFIQRTSSNIRLLWQTTEGQDSTSDDRFEATVGVTRNIFSYMNGNVEYRYITQQSDLSNNDFSENRISASLSMQF